MIFLVSCNATLGYSVDNMVERYNMNDARIFHSVAWWWLEEAYQPISSDLPKEIEELPFVTDVEVMYRARTMPDYEEDAWGRQYTDSSAEVSLGGALKEEMETCAGSEAFLNTYGDHGISEQAANNRWKMRILGVPAGMIEQEMEYSGTYKGKVDVEKFAAGEEGESFVKLTATEIRLLEVFLKHRNQVLTREQLLGLVWDAYENYVDEKTLNVNIRRLREKIEDDPKEPVYIKTVFGIGYKWSDKV